MFYYRRFFSRLIRYLNTIFISAYFTCPFFSTLISVRRIRCHLFFIYLCIQVTFPFFFFSSWSSTIRFLNRNSPNILTSLLDFQESLYITFLHAWIFLREFFKSIVYIYVQLLLFLSFCFFIDRWMTRNISRSPCFSIFSLFDFSLYIFLSLLFFVNVNHMHLPAYLLLNLIYILCSLPLLF